jgi:hypothetical protein
MDSSISSTAIDPFLSEENALSVDSGSQRQTGLDGSCDESRSGFCAREDVFLLEFGAVVVFE